MVVWVSQGIPQCYPCLRTVLPMSPVHTGVKPLHLGLNITRAEHVVRLGLAARRAEDALREVARGMYLKMQPGAAIEKFHEQLRLRPVFLHVRGAEEIFRIAREER